MDRFDFVVIGDGAAGDSIVRPAAGAGKRVALFEHDRLGGECLNYGCVPSKVLYQSAEVFHQMQARRRIWRPGQRGGDRFPRRHRPCSGNN